MGISSTVALSVLIVASSLWFSEGRRHEHFQGGMQFDGMGGMQGRGGPGMPPRDGPGMPPRDRPGSSMGEENRWDDGLGNSMGTNMGASTAFRSEQPLGYNAAGMPMGSGSFMRGNTAGGRMAMGSGSSSMGGYTPGGRMPVRSGSSMGGYIAGGRLPMGSGSSMGGNTAGGRMPMGSGTGEMGSTFTAGKTGAVMSMGNNIGGTGRTRNTPGAFGSGMSSNVGMTGS